MHIVLFTFFEIMNLCTHVVLRNLRSRGQKDRGIPYVLIRSDGKGLWIRICVMCELLLGDVYLGMLRTDGQLSDNLHLLIVVILPDERMGADEASSLHNGVHGEEWNTFISSVRKE